MAVYLPGSRSWLAADPSGRRPMRPSGRQLPEVVIADLGCRDGRSDDGVRWGRDIEALVRGRPSSVSCARLRSVTRSRCVVPGRRDVILTREAGEAPWQAAFTAAPGRRRAFEPSVPSVPSVAQGRPAPWPGATARAGPPRTRGMTGRPRPTPRGDRRRRAAPCRAPADLPKNRGRHLAMAAMFGGHIFERVRKEQGITHELAKPRRPWTNGQAGRMSRTVEDAPVRASTMRTRTASRPTSRRSSRPATTPGPQGHPVEDAV